MARSRWKLMYFSKSVWRKIVALKKNKKLRRRRLFYDRSSFIPDCFFSNFIKIHKGKRYRNLLIDNFVIGKKFGEFSYTRKPFYFPTKKAKKKKTNNRKKII